MNRHGKARKVKKGWPQDELYHIGARLSVSQRFAPPGVVATASICIITSDDLMVQSTKASIFAAAGGAAI
jgi:hypothetical protein